MDTALATDLETVANVVVRLRASLEHARTLKVETTVEPPLPTEDLVGEVDDLHGDFPDSYDQASRFSAVEAAAREMFQNLIHSINIDEPAFVEVWDLLDIVLLIGDRRRCDPGLVCLLIEELLDGQTTLGCRTVFDYLESRRERLAHKDFHKKHLVFLRSCNELLRRLSRAEDASFCGRVFFFLFQTFPLGDKSSVNLRGEFHVENSTAFQEPDVKMQDDGSDETPSSSLPAQPVAEEGGTQPRDDVTKSHKKPPPAKTSNKKTNDDGVLPSIKLYPIFWRLQQGFSDPTRLYEPENFAAFKDGLEKTISKFKKTPTVVQTKALEEDKRRVKRQTDGNGDDEGDRGLLVDNYNPKYLTSFDLFDLELSDLAFQRHILVQALILIDFLLSLTEKARARLVMAVPTPNKSLMYKFTLNDEDTKWAASTRSTITSYLGLTQEGRQYCRMVETVLVRDKNWVRWKAENCPSILRGPVSVEDELAARKGARDAVRPRRITDKPMGGMDLSFLEEGQGGGFEALKKRARSMAPSIEELVDGVKMDKLDAEMAMDEDEKTSFENAMTNKKWRALRQARMTDLSLLEGVDTGKDLEEIFSRSDREEEENTGEMGGDDGGTAIGIPISTDVEPSLVSDDKTLGVNADTA